MTDRPEAISRKPLVVGAPIRFERLEVRRVLSGFSFVEDDPIVEQHATSDVGQVYRGSAFSLAADLDGDETVDALVASNLAGSLSLHKNSLGRFADRQPAELSLGASALDIHSLDAADFDGDGDQDILARVRRAGEWPRLAWFRNLDGVFSDPEFIEAEGTGGESGRVSSVHIDNSVLVLDLDGDLDIDIVANGHLGPGEDSRLLNRYSFWLENDGAGQFAYHALDSTVPIVEAADVDGDGEYELLDVDGNLRDLDGTAQADCCDAFPNDIISATAGDIDANGHIDFAVASRRPGAATVDYSWVMNNGETFDTFRVDTKTFIEPELETGLVLGETRKLTLSDLDFDGDLDLFVVENGITPSVGIHVGLSVVWYENEDGLGSFGAREVIGVHALPDRSILGVATIADIDLDGYQDVLTTTLMFVQHDVRIRTSWYQNRMIGDADGDGAVNFRDFLALAQNFGTTNATWHEGDFDQDGVIAFEDFLLLAEHYGESRFPVALE